MTTENRSTKLKSALESINVKINTMKKISETSYKTHGDFRFNPNYTYNDAVNIFKITKIEVLLNIYAYLAPKQEEYDKAAKDCGLVTYPLFEWIGCPVKDWLHDLKLRITVLNQHRVLKHLESKRKELEGFLEKDDRLDMLLESLEDDGVLKLTE